MSTSSRTQTLSVRVTPVEGLALRLGAQALQLSVSSLFEYAVIDAAQQYGFSLSGRDAHPERRPAPKWKDAPTYRTESASVRMSLAITPALLGLLARVTDWLDVNPTTFLIGATLRFISNVKKSDLTGNKLLASVVLPDHYQ
jgi:hypothetical protein